MPVLFLLVGAVFLAAAVRGKEETQELMLLIRGDFSGPNNFFVWAFAVGTVAGLGYWKPIRPISNMLLALVFVAIILRNSGSDGQGNVLTQFFNQLQTIGK